MVQTTLENYLDDVVLSDWTTVPDGESFPLEEELSEAEWETELTRLGRETTTPPPAHPEPWQLSESALLDEIEATGQALARLTARRCLLLAEAERRGATGERLGLSTSGWLVHNLTHSQRRAKAEVALALRVAAEPLLVAALGEGRLSVEQAERLTRGLDRLPDELSAAQRERVVAQLVEFADEHGPDALSILANRAVEVVAPEVAEAADRAWLERREAEQARERYLALRQDPDGAWLLQGKLTTTAGAHLRAQLGAVAAGLRASAGAGLSRGQALADALLVVLGHHASCGAGPRHGADRPRVTLTVSLATLQGSLGTACLVDTDTPITAQQARRLACDAGIVPVVLGGASEPLDVGRERRLFTGSLRQAVILRDRGCVFPGCDRPPADCEVHHKVPWWNGGETSLANAALLCPYHHHLVEPDPHRSPESQWELGHDGHGLPHFLAPLDPRHPSRPRLYRQHHRFRL